MKQVELSEALDMMDKSIHSRLIDGAKGFRATHIAIYENQQMDSSSHGQRTALFVGPNNTLKSPDDLNNHWINDSPSQRQYPVAYARIDSE